MNEFVNDWLPYIVLAAVYFVVSGWVARRQQRRNAAQAKAIQDEMIAAYRQRHGEA